MKKNKKKVLKPSRIVFLIVLLASNTLAWFIYATKIDTHVDVHVRAWNVVFESDENEVENTVNVSVGSIFPGMEDYEYELKAYNRSEVSATMTYQVLSARILEDEYVSIEYKEMNGETVLPTDLTAAQLESKLANDYPFSIDITTSNSSLQQENGMATFSLTVSWPYESNQDAVDTFWGVSAYEFKEDNPTLPSIEILIKVTITQSNSGSGGSGGNS